MIIILVTTCIYFYTTIYYKQFSKWNRKLLMMMNIQIKEKEYFGECTTCNRYNTDYLWYQSCDPQKLTQGWTNGNETLDKIIRNTQLGATSYSNYWYLQWISYKDLRNIEKVGITYYIF